MSAEKACLFKFSSRSYLFKDNYVSLQLLPVHQLEGKLCTVNEHILLCQLSLIKSDFWYLKKIDEALVWKCIFVR